MQVNYLDDGEKSLLTERDKYDLNVLSGLEWEWMASQQQRSHVTWLLFVFWLASRWRMILLTAAGSISGKGFLPQPSIRRSSWSRDASITTSPPPVDILSTTFLSLELCWLRVTLKKLFNIMSFSLREMFSKKTEMMMMMMMMMMIINDIWLHIFPLVAFISLMSLNLNLI